MTAKTKYTGIRTLSGAAWVAEQERRGMLIETRRKVYQYGTKTVGRIYYSLTMKGISAEIRALEAADAAERQDEMGRKTTGERVFENIQQLLNDIELNASEQTNQELQDGFIVKDDSCHWWYFTGDKIKMLGDDSGEEGGYDCATFADGVFLLEMNGYITK